MCTHIYIYIYLFIYKFIYAVLNKATSWQMMASWIPRLLGPVPAFHGHHHTAGLADQAPEMGATRRQSEWIPVATGWYCHAGMCTQRWDLTPAGACYSLSPAWPTLNCSSTCTGGQNCRVPYGGVPEKLRPVELLHAHFCTQENVMYVYIYIYYK